MRERPEIIEARILVLDDNKDILQASELLLSRYFSDVKTLNEPRQLANLVRRNTFDVLLLDMNFTPGADDGREGLARLKEVLEIDPHAIVVIITAHSNVDLAVKAMKLGAADFVMKPWENERLVATVSMAANLRRSQVEATELRERNQGLAAATHQDSGMIGNAPAMLRVFDAIRRTGPTAANVLITGENGTGKELVAREIHRLSDRSNEVFLRVDMGSLSPNVFESELFGHKRGAFTDAKHDRTGFFRAATGGTLFLDEIGNVPLHLQSKLLTAFERREVVPVGAEKAVQIDVRLICATNLSQHQLCDETIFRQDLLYRINTVEIVLPPLRGRPNDIALLLTHYTAHYSRKYGVPTKRISGALIEKLTKYSWPGNIRALRHAVERAVILCEGDVLDLVDFPIANTDYVKPDAKKDNSLKLAERATIIRALRKHKNNISHAAEELGLTRTSLYRRIEKYGL
jgi:DNA-binding NtrC family response regulator